MTFYTCTVILTVLMMIAMTLHVVTYTGFTKVQKNWYILTFASIMFCCLAEYAVHCGYYNPKFAIPLTILTVIQFSVSPMLGLLFSGALGIHHQKKIALVFYSISLLVQVVSAPFGWIFRFDENGYSRGNLFFIYGILYFISLIYLMFSMIIVGRRFRHRDFLTILMVVVLLIAGIIPMTINKINIAYTSIGICACICYIYYNDLVQQDTYSELIEEQQRISYMQSHMISGLANLIENRDTETGEHISRTSTYVKLIANFAKNDGVYAYEIDDKFLELMITLAPMHDIGKIIIPDRILKKPGRLTDEEFEQMKKHAAVGGTVVREVLNGVTDEEFLQFASDVATYHHEWWNGKGYPKGLQGLEIPLSARIMALADVYDALISERCYKKPMSPEEAFKIIEDESGTHFDPKLTKVFLDHKEAFIIGKNEKDE